MLMWYKSNIYFYKSMLKTAVLVYIFVETMMHIKKKKSYCVRNHQEFRGFHLTTGRIRFLEQWWDILSTLNQNCHCKKKVSIVFKKDCSQTRKCLNSSSLKIKQHASQ